MGSHVLFRGPGERPPPAGSHETHQGPPGHSPVQVIREEDLSGTWRSRQGGSNPELRLEDGEGLDGLSAPASVTALLGDPTQEHVAGRDPQAPPSLSESFTPDHKPLMGEAPELCGFFLGCGFNSAGERGQRGLDASCRLRRQGPSWAPPQFSEPPLPGVGVGLGALWLGLGWRGDRPARGRHVAPQG